MHSDLPVTRIRWRRSIRLIPTRFPPIQLFEKVASPEDLDAVFALESMTNPRLRDEVGNLELVTAEERVSGPGSSPVMAAFTHPNPIGSRYADATYGVYYAARDLDTAIAETAFHRARFMAATQEPTTELSLRMYVAHIDARLHDVREFKQQYPEWFDKDPTRYAPTQALAKALRHAGANGIVYPSVRHAGGHCVAIFKPRCIRLPVRDEGTLRYLWDGAAQAITRIYQLTPLTLATSTKEP